MEPVEAAAAVSLPAVRTTSCQKEEESDGGDTPIAPPAPPKSPWVLGLCSVVFDVDKGQTLQELWPPDCLSEEEQAAVAFHAFPDSLSMELHTRNAIRDSSFSFRIKREPECFSSDGTPEFLYGYVFCRQRQDETLRRGGEQVSVVVLAAAPLSGALLPLSQAAGHSFFNEGALALAMVYNQVLAWPPPVPGSSMCLPIGAGGMINTRLPRFSLLPPPQPAVDPAVQATLSRRISRQLSRKASGSPRIIALAAATRSGSAGSGSGSGELTAVLGSAAAAAADADAAAAASAAALTQPGKHQEQQQQPASPSSGATMPAAADTPPSAAAEVAAAAVESSGVVQQPQAAADDSGWSIVEQQQQQPAKGLSSGGSFSSLLGFSRASSSSRLSRADLSAAGAADASGNAVSSSAALPAAGGSATTSSSSAGSEWLVSTLGQQWRDEKPFPEVEPALVLAPLLRDLWTLWQLVVTAQPLMVVGLSPSETSAAVSALVSLISPLVYAADFRPYFTIHDPAFVGLASGQLPKRQRYQEARPQPLEQQQQQQQSEQLEQQQQQSEQQLEQPEQQRGAEEQPSDASPTAVGAALPQPPEGKQQLDQPQPQQPSQQPRSKAASTKPLALPALLGVTNLYFIRALGGCGKWGVVAVSRKEVSTTSTPSPSAAAATAPAATATNNGSSSSSQSPAKASRGAATSGDDAAANTSAEAAAGSPTVALPAEAAAAAAGTGSRPASGSGLFSSTAAAAVRAIQRRHQGPQHLLSHFAPHLWTASSSRHVQCVKPDHALLSKARAAIEPAVGAAGAAAGLAAGSGAAGGCGGTHGSCSSSSVLGPTSPAGAAAARLRRHFAELTAGLLAPFERYFTPGANGKVPAWCPDHFLASLDACALHPALAARLSGNATARTLYASFLESPSFSYYFQQRRAPVLHLVEWDEPESDADDEEDDEGFSKVDAAADGVDSEPRDGVDSEPDEVELVQQLLCTEQVLLDWQAQQAQKRQQQQAEGQKGASTEGAPLPPAHRGPQPAQHEQRQEQALQQQFVRVFLQLPRDLQTALFTSPARQALLNEAASVLAAGGRAEQEAAAAVLQTMRELLISAAGGGGG